MTNVDEHNRFPAALKAALAVTQAGAHGVPDEQRRAFAVTLVNRLLFLKFVERKGWLDGDRDYLANRFRQAGAGRFWPDVLVPLCSGELIGAVPRLSAELFARSTAWNDTQVAVEARVFTTLFDTLLNPYAFTFAAAPPGARACTQETLGFAYEALIADRHGQGAYYTHPAEVALMCRESLRSYLHLHCPQVDQAAVAELLSHPPDAAQTVPGCSPEHALPLYAALHAVTVCDPATGSGMFLVAMLRQICAGMRALGRLLVDYAPFRVAVDGGGLTDPQDAFALGSHILTHSLYGCDIDTRAIECARLRLRIELLSTCDTPRPLPNLAETVRVGEALIGVVGTRADGTLVTLEDGRAWPAPAARVPADAKPEVKIPADLAHLVALRGRYVTACTPAEAEHLRTQVATARARVLRLLAPDCPAHRYAGDHVVWPVDFPAIFHSAQPGFDILIGNPPYLRQELIDAAYAALGSPVRKHDLQDLYHRLSGCRVKGSADLYIYFFLRGLALLRPDGGTLCYISSNAWLDVAYGAALQHAIVTRTAACTIYDSHARRSFDAAAVNTAITLLQTAGAPGRAGRRATFVLFNQPFEHISGRRDPVAHPGSARVHTVAYADLGSGSAVQGHWGGRYLRAPDAVLQVMARCRSQLVPLARLANMRFGIKTGANAFFYLDQATIAAWGIEAEFLRPVVRTPRECGSIFVDPARLQHRLLVCDADRCELTGTRVLEYIRWGEAQGFDRRPSCRARARWYAVRARQPADFIALRFRDLRNWTPLIPAGDLAISDTVFVGTFYDRRLVSVGSALLNTTLCVLMSEVYGRANLGDGLLTTYGPDILALPVVDPRSALPHAEALAAGLHALAQREVRSILEEIHLPDRCALDTIVFDILGLSAGERDAVYEAVAEMVERRICKARSHRAAAG